MPISAARLVAALAARLDPAVPRPFSVSAAGPVLVLDHPEGWGAQKYLDWIEGPGWLAEAVAEAGPDGADALLAERGVLTVLDNLQDDIPEALQEPWPALTPTTFAPAGARCDGVVVHLWYGESEGAPVIAFAPIPLRELLAGADEQSRAAR